MRIELITDLKKMEGLQADWDRLVAAGPIEHAALYFAWFKNWWEAFGEGRRLNVLLVKDKGEVIFIAPLMISEPTYFGLPTKELGFMANSETPSCDFIYSMDDTGKLAKIAAFMFSYLESQLKQWDVIRLRHLQKESQFYGLLKKRMSSINALCLTKESICSPYIKLGTDWQSYYSSLGKRLRKSLRNSFNSLAGYDPEFSCYQGPIKQEVLEDIFTVSSRSWKRKCGADLGSCANSKKFFSGLAVSSGGHCSVAVWIMYLKKRPVAYEYHLRSAAKVYALRADFDEEYSSFSTGTLLHAHILKQYFQDGGLLEYDMCGHTDAYKMKFTSSVREHVIFSTYRKSFYGKLLFRLESRLFYPLKKALAATPLKSILKKRKRR